MRARLKIDRSRLIFFASYTILFVLAVKSAGFVMPFILAMINAVVMKPLYDYLRLRFSFRSDFAAMALTLLVFAVFLSAAGFLMFLIVRQGLSLFDAYGYLISDYLRSPELFETVKDSLLSGRLFDTAAGLIAGVFRTVPLAVTFAAVTFALSVFFLRRVSDIRDILLRRTGKEYSPLMSRIFSIGYGMIRSFIRSYMILYLITFIEAVFIFYLTGVEYPLPFAFITALADLLPVLGPAAVYVPISAVFILNKNYLAGITIMVFFLITVIIRQITEPKIVSDSVKLHPLVVLSAIYFSIVSMNIWVLFYVISVFIVFRILNEAGVFEKSIDNTSDKENKKVDISKEESII